MKHEKPDTNPITFIKNALRPLKSTFKTRMNRGFVAVFMWMFAGMSVGLGGEFGIGMLVVLFSLVLVVYLIWRDVKLSVWEETEELIVEASK